MSRSRSRSKHALHQAIETEIVKNWFAAIADEMSVTLIRSAFSTKIKEAADASCAIFDLEAQLVAQSQGSGSMHLASLRECAKAVLEDYPLSSHREGDAYLMNDPYRGGIHSNDVHVFSPVFSGGRPRFIAGAIVHVADLGGVAAGGLPPEATEVYHEGLLLPPIPFQRAGQVEAGLVRLLELNSRSPTHVLGDIRALVAATQVGARRLGEFLTRHGATRARELVDNVLDYTETLTRLEIEKLPEGEFHGQYRVDDDGIDFDREFWVRVAIRRSGSDLVVDLTGTSPQARGPINSSYTQSLAGVWTGLRYFIDPSIPTNEGCFRPLRVVLPEGTLVNPRPPGAVNARIATVSAMVESMLQVLSQQRPECTMAASGTVHVYTMAGSSTDTGRKSWLFLDRDWGGVGAVWGSDGVDCSTPTGGRGAQAQMETYEAEYPVRFESHRLLTDSGGPGTWRGGLGVERTIRVLTEAVASARTDRVRFPPLGASGGAAGRAGAWIVNKGLPDERVLRPKHMNVRLAPNDTLTMQTSGGGGVGPPAERAPDRVADDLAHGKISEAGANEQYGRRLTAGTTS